MSDQRIGGGGKKLAPIKHGKLEEQILAFPEPQSVVRPQVRGPLRVATFNVGMMSTFVRNFNREGNILGAVTEGIVNLFMTDADAVELGDRLANRLLLAPYDIVVLQELFHADARKRIIDRLRDESLSDAVRYPFIRTGFGAEERTPADNPQPMISDVLDLPWDLDDAAIGALRSFFDDSGLLVASRLPLHTFGLNGNATTWAFARYSAAAGIDAVAPKGAAAVVAQPPGWPSPVAVVFTHMQADDDKAHVRKLQFEQLVWLASGVAASAGTQDLIIMGDLNVRGEFPADAPETGAEYVEVFGPSGILGSLGEDGWRDGACAPAAGADPAPERFDRSLTQPSDGPRQRLDYVIAGRIGGRIPRSQRELAAQHLMIATNLDDGEVSPESPVGLGPEDLSAPRGHVHLSDHFGVNAIVGHGGEHSAPRFALPCTPANLSAPSPERSADFEDVPHGELRWLLLEPGAYRIALSANFGGRNVDLEVYNPTDVSRALADVMPPTPTPTDRRRGRRYPAVSHPLLVRLHSVTPSLDNLQVTVRVVVGATPDDAVSIRPWEHTAPSPWPTPAQGGQPERARWFEVLLDPPAPATEQRVSFHIRRADKPDKTEGDALGGTFDVFPGTSIETPEADLVTPATTLEPGKEHVVIGSTDAERRFLVRATPDSAERDAEAVVEVRTDLRFMVGLGFKALDETGPDWSGADEIKWTITSDLDPSGSGPSGMQDDVDSEESFGMPTGGPLAFRDHVRVVLTELSGALAGEDVGTTFVLPGKKEHGEERHIDGVLVDDISDGTYRVNFTWLRSLKYE